jgi:TonB family protein
MTEALKHWEAQLVGGKFHLQQHLGGSDHSSVFLTEREGQKAAIKLIPAELKYAELELPRLQRAARLSHPNLIRLFDMGRCQVGNEELLYVVMEYAPENLSQVLLDRPLTPAETRDMLRPALKVLAYLHGKNLVHGHIKPRNIMAIDDQLKISSDGICERGDLGARRGATDVYDPPEATGAGKSAAGDVWSLGVTLVEALTQRLPQWERTYQQEEPILPGTLPAPFLDIARQCLRREPRDRCTVGDIVARLQPPSPAQQTKASPKAGNASAKWRYIVPTIVAVLAVAAILAGPIRMHKHPETAPTSSGAPEQTAQESPESQTGKPAGKMTDRQGPSDGGTASTSPVRLTTGTNTGAGSRVRGKVAHQVLPDVPQRARDTIRGTIKVGVKVHVDPSGSVVGTSLASPERSKYFGNLAVEASRRWRFAPAKVDGQNASSEWVLQFEFTRAQTKVNPVQTAP